MEFIELPRRGGKTTKALEILKDNENSILICHNLMSKEIDHTILDATPDLKKRIFALSESARFLRGNSKIQTIIIDNADLIPTRQLLELMRGSPYHFILTLTLR